MWSCGPQNAQYSRYYCMQSSCKENSDLLLYMVCHSSSNLIENCNCHWLVCKVAWSLDCKHILLIDHHLYIAKDMSHLKLYCFSCQSILDFQYLMWIFSCCFQVCQSVDNENTILYLDLNVIFSLAYLIMGWFKTDRTFKDKFPIKISKISTSFVF